MSSWRFFVGKAIKEIKYFESKRPKITIVATEEEFTFRGKLDEIQEQIEMSAETLYGKPIKTFPLFNFYKKLSKIIYQLV